MKLIRKGRVTVILVYADWCGHCHHFMPHFDKAANNPNRSVQAAKINETMLADVNKALTKNNHAATPIHVDGYPSVILVDNQGKKITDVEPVKDTAAMTKVMNESGSLAENAGISEGVKNSMDDTSSIVPIYKRSSPSITSVNSSITPDFIVNTSMDMGENEGVSMTPVNKKLSVAKVNVNKPATISTNAKNSAKSMEEQAESLAALQGVSSNQGPNAAMISPSLPNEDLESIREPRTVKGGSLYSAMAQTAYTLAAPAALLATAALIMRRSRKNQRRFKKHTMRRTTRHAKSKRRHAHKN
jgi:thiol-disulfide isomerase/thioredoxin